jgi:hypothetical protein
VARQGQGVPFQGMNRGRAGIVGLALLAVVSGLVLGGAGSAQAVTVTKPDITATVTASVSPTRLPAQGAAPVTLTLAGTFSRPDATVPSPLRSMSFLLDRQLTVTTAGLPVCPLGKLNNGASVTYARKVCGSALIGSGTSDEAFHPPEGSSIPPSERHFGVLLFNGKQGVLLFSYALNPAPGEFPSIVSIGSGRRLSIRMGAGLGSTASFRFRLGRTWRDDGKQRSYLSGRCATGTLTNQITLAFADGDVSDAAPQRCTRRG